MAKNSMRRQPPKMNDATQQLVHVLEWSITTFTLQRYHDNPHADAEWATDDNRSPEMRQLMDMYDAFQEGRLVVVDGRKD